MRFSASGRVLLAAIVVATAAIAGGIAFAAIPDSSGVIHGCYNPNGAKAQNGTTLNIIDSDTASCRSNLAAITWNQTGPQGPAGADGAKGDKGDKGDTGDTGPPGPSAAYANYGDGFHTIAAGNTQTVASVTVPAGSYVLSGAVQAIGVDDGEFTQCSFVAAGTVNGLFAVLVDDSAEPLLADVTLSSPLNPIFLRCNAQGGTIQAAGQMIATRVGTVTASV